MDRSQDNDIVASVLKGDREAYSLLVEAYKTQIFNLAYRMTGSYEDAGDLAQETFVRAYAHLKKFDSKKRFFTWLYTIGLNLIRNHLKKKGGVLSRETTDRKSSETEIRGDDHLERDVIRRQEIGRLNACLPKLPADLRESIILRFYQDLSFEEIATISGASLSAVKMRVYRGLERLKKLMGEDG